MRYRYLEEKRRNTKQMHLELAKTLRNYDRKNLSKDILTGLIIMAVSIPISMGYVQIAGLPAVYADNDEAGDRTRKTEE